MATFQKRAGHWRAQIRKKGIPPQSATFATKAQAVAWALEIEVEAASVARGGLPNKTLRQALERYRDEVSPTKRGKRWEQIRIDAFIGGGDKAGTMADLVGRKLADVTTANLAEWRDARLRQVSPASVLRECNLLGSVLETARREWQWLRENPMKDMRRPTAPAHRTRRIADDEIKRITLALGYEDARPVATLSQQVAIAWLLAIETAMRQGEILSLTWAAISGRVAHLPKTKNGHARDVPLSSRAVELLEKLRGLHEATCFTVSAASCDALFRKARDSAGVVGMRFHDSRREATSRLSRRVDVLTLARITGHRDLKMLLVYYQTDMRSVANLLD